MIVIAIGLVILSIVLIISPWLSKKNSNQDVVVEQSIDVSKDVYLQQLVDLEYDHEMGKVSRSDYDLGKQEIMGKIVSLSRYYDLNHVEHVVDDWLRERGIEN